MKNEKIKLRLKKLYELAKRGEENEKDTAQKILDELLLKYNISLSEIISDIKKERKYKFTYSWQENIISQVAYMITYSKDIYSYRNKNFKYIEIKATDYEHIQITELISFHFKTFRTEYEKFKKDFIESYIRKYELFPTDNEECLSRKEDIDYEKYLRIKNIMMNIEVKQFYKSIEN